MLYKSLRFLTVALSVGSTNGMAFGMRTLGRRLTMSATGRGTTYTDITKTIGNTP